MECLSPGTQALVPVPNQHSQRADQSDTGRGREPAGRGHHLVQCHLSSDTASHLAPRVQTPGSLTETRRDSLCARYVQISPGNKSWWEKKKVYLYHSCVIEMKGTFQLSYMPISYKPNWAHFETVQLLPECDKTCMTCGIGLHRIQMAKQVGFTLQHHRNAIWIKLQ